jgi:hypothetical protein
MRLRFVFGERGMPSLTFQNLAEHTIARHHINGVALRGKGELAELSGVGPVLKIHIPDPAGEFDVVLHESRFKGPILEDKESGCDYRIALQASDLVSQSQRCNPLA